MAREISSVTGLIEEVNKIAQQNVAKKAAEESMPAKLAQAREEALEAYKLDRSSLEHNLLDLLPYVLELTQEDKEPINYLLLRAPGKSLNEGTILALKPAGNSESYSVESGIEISYYHPTIPHKYGDFKVVLAGLPQSLDIGEAALSSHETTSQIVHKGVHLGKVTIKGIFNPAFDMERSYSEARKMAGELLVPSLKA